MSSIVDTIIQKLQPSMQEYADNAQFYHWMDYACELDELDLLNFADDKEGFVSHINNRMSGYPSAHALHHACCDVASTVESLVPEYRGLFVY